MTTDEKPLPSFEQLAAELSGPLFGYLRKMLGNGADADDLLQETLMRIARSLPTLEKSAAVKSWAFRIASNLAIDHIRRNKRASLVEFTEEHDPDDQEEDRLVLDEMNSCVREVIDGLPPDYRAAIVLFNLEGKSVSETAEILGTSIGAAKVRIHRAKKRLKEALNRECVYYTTPDAHLRRLIVLSHHIAWEVMSARHLFLFFLLGYRNDVAVFK
jgi:RNA polymerase sigma-70 factor (ECF subfamily)